MTPWAILIRHKHPKNASFKVVQVVKSGLWLVMDDDDDDDDDDYDDEDVDDVEP